MDQKLKYEKANYFSTAPLLPASVVRAASVHDDRTQVSLQSDEGTVNHLPHSDFAAVTPSLHSSLIISLISLYMHISSCFSCSQNRMLDIKLY